MTYTIQPGDLAGFHLAAEIVNGHYRMYGSKALLQEPPTELTLCGNTYMFEYLQIGQLKIYSFDPTAVQAAIQATLEKRPNWCSEIDGYFCNLCYV